MVREGMNRNPTVTPPKSSCLQNPALSFCLSFQGVPHSGNRAMWEVPEAGMHKLGQWEVSVPQAGVALEGCQDSWHPSLAVLSAAVVPRCPRPC